VLDWQHGVNDIQQGVEGGLDGVESVDAAVAVEDLLKDLGVGDEPLAISDESFKHPLGVDFVRVRGSHEVHRNVGVDEDHDPSPEYPRSISASI